MSNLAFEDMQPSAERRRAAPPIARPTSRPVPRISIQAFCESPELAAAIEAAAADRRMARAHVKVHTGGIAAAAEFYQARRHAEPDHRRDRKLPRDRLDAELDRLAEVCDAGTKVVVIGHVNDVELYREPDPARRQRISRRAGRPDAASSAPSPTSTSTARRQPLGRTIAFIGAKGGVGSSMVAHNVAWAIARSFENDVVVADLDLAFGTAGLDFNQDPPQGIAEAVHAPDRLDDNFLDRLLAKCSDHLSLLAAPATLDRTYDFDEGAFEQVHRRRPGRRAGGRPRHAASVDRLGQARRCSPPTRWCSPSSPTSPICATPRTSSTCCARRAPNDAPPRLVINKSGIAKRPEIKLDDFAAALDLTPMAVIPFDAQLFGTAANNGQMIAETDAKSPIVGRPST